MYPCLASSRLLSVCCAVIEEQSPGPPASKSALASLANPPSLSPIKIKTKTKDEPPETATNGADAKPSTRPGRKGEYVLHRLYRDSQMRDCNTKWGRSAISGFSNAGSRPQMGSVGNFLNVALKLWGRWGREQCSEPGRYDHIIL